MNKHVILGTLLVAAAAVACGGSKGGHPDAAPNVDANNMACGSGNPFGTCAAGMKCTWIVDADDPTANNCQGTFLGHVGCAPAGDVALAGACAFQSCNDGSTPGSDGKCADGKPKIGADNCSAGLFCISRRCETICSTSGGNPACDDQHACSQYTDVFSTGNSTALAGVCDERCDPNTQRTLAGSAEACRSVDVAQSGSGSAEVYPEFGCYEDDSANQNARLVDFTCADTPFGRSTGPGSGVNCTSTTVTAPVEDHQDCTDQESCSVTVNGMVFVIPNGCAPGYVNLINAKQASMQAICSAYCAPLDTDSGSAANAIGDLTALGKDVTDSAAKAGRATCKQQNLGGKAGIAGETCQYAWTFDLDKTTGLISNLGPIDIDTVGICVHDVDFEYDPTNSGGSATKIVPTCDTLRPGDLGDNANCAGSGDACGSNFQCISNVCRDATVACGSNGSGSASGEGSNAADCFASFHLGPVGSCYSAVREGFLMIGSGSGSAVAPPHNRPMLDRVLSQLPEVRLPDRAAFRRPGGIN